MILGTWYQLTGRNARVGRHRGTSRRGTTARLGRIERAVSAGERAFHRKGEAGQQGGTVSFTGHVSWLNVP